jgi:hypothetical protein
MKIKKFQMGGAMDPAMAGAEMGAEAGAAAGAEAGAMGAEGAASGDPIMELVQMAAEALQAQDPNMAMAVCEGLIALVQGGAPAPGGEEPVMMRRGGKMCGAKKKAKKC